MQLYVVAHASMSGLGTWLVRLQSAQSQFEMFFYCPFRTSILPQSRQSISLGLVFSVYRPGLSAAWRWIREDVIRRGVYQVRTVLQPMLFEVSIWLKHCLKTRLLGRKIRSQCPLSARRSTNASTWTRPIIEGVTWQLSQMCFFASHRPVVNFWNLIVYNDIYINISKSPRKSPYVGTCIVSVYILVRLLQQH